MSLISTMMSTLYLGLGVNLISQIPWSILFLLLQPFGIRLYILKKKEECKIIQKKIGTWSSHLTDNKKSFGYSIGYWYIMSISITESDRDGELFNITLIATESTFDNLIKETNTVKETNTNEVIVNKKQSSILFYERFGSYYSVWYKKRTINIPKVIPRIDQQNIIDNIILHQKKNKHSVVMLHGLPGSGKSMIGLFLANQYNGSYCNSLIPWQPGDTLNHLYYEVEPSEENPLILVFEEIDRVLIKINQGIDPHKNLPISVHDKTGWNNLLDAIQRGLYPHLILLLTSNKKPEFINELDTSYIRKGRVDLIFEVKNEI